MAEKGQKGTTTVPALFGKPLAAPTPYVFVVSKMVSRTPRHQSQPRPTNPQQTNSMDAWDHGNINGSNGHASYQYDQRRAKSSIRYQSSGRDHSRAQVRDRTETQKDMHGIDRPRPISAGRARSQADAVSHVDPSEVAKQILDQRERRESSATVKRKEMTTNNKNSGLRPSGPHGHVKTSLSRGGSSSGGIGLKTVGSSMSQEEIQAEERLKQAEGKISGLLQELEELKFFQEIEMEQPVPTTPRTPKPAVSRNVVAPNGPPTMIRAPSPARGGRLPPPPPPPSSQQLAVSRSSSMGDKGGLETYRPLSPRSISKLDRNSLELECQTLVRKLQILEQDKSSHAATIEMYETSLQQHDADKTKIHRLEEELQKVSLELKKQLHNIQKGKESLIGDYEEKLQGNLKKLHRLQEKADSYKTDFEAAKGNAEKYRLEMERHRVKAAEGQAHIDELARKEETLQMQLQEARNLNATLAKKVEKKRTEVSTLKEDLSTTNRMMEDGNRDREEAHEARVTALEQQLALAKERYSRLEFECNERNSTLVEKENALNEARLRQSELENNNLELNNRVQEMGREIEAKYEEGKKASKTLETKKVQELVAERANAAREYERRIKAMQEQLRHQTDRHHAEIQETRLRNEKKLESMRDEIRQEIRLKEGDRVSQLESEMAKLNRNYEEEKMSFTARLHEAHQKARETASDFQNQHLMQQQELDHLHDRLNSYQKEINEKDKILSEQKDHLDDQQRMRQEIEKKLVEQTLESERQQDLLQSERTKLLESEARLNEEVDSMRLEFSEHERSLMIEIREAHGKLHEVEKKLVEAQERLKENERIHLQLQEVQDDYDRTRKQLFADRARHEDVESELRLELAKMEGKLRACDVAVQSKKARVEELEQQLDVTAVTSSKVGEEKQKEIFSLRKHLEEMTNRLDSEREATESRQAQIEQLLSEGSKLREENSKFSNLEDKLQDMKRKMSTVEREKADKEDEFLEAKKSYESMRSKLLEAEQRYSNLKNDFSERLEKKEKLLERYDKTIKDLEFDLERERSDKADMKRSINELESDKLRKESELSSLRKDYEDLSGLLEENLHSSAKKDELGLLLKKKEHEMRETVDIYNRQFSDLECKMKEEAQSKDEMLQSIVKLQKTLDKVEDEKIKLFSDMTEVQRKYKDACEQLETIKEDREKARGGIAADLDRKDRQMREAIQRYTRTIADLESRLEEETQSKVELEDRLSSARSELEDKQRQTQEFVQRHTKSNFKLESDLEKSAAAVEALKVDLDQTKADLQKKIQELSDERSKHEDEIALLESVKQEHSEYREISQSTRDELLRKDREISDMKHKITDLLVEVESKKKETMQHKETSERYELELKQRKDQLAEVVAKYSDQIAELESKLDEHSVVHTTTKDRVESVQAEASRKDTKIKELLKSVADLEAKLEVANRTREATKQKAESLSKDLDEKDALLRNFEVEKIELETKLHTQSRSRDELRTKISQLSSRLERKEREVREVSDRYKMYVMELESKLDQDTDAKHHLQLEIDKLRSNLNSANELSSETSELRQKVYSMEKSIDTYKIDLREAESKAKETTKSLNEQLDEAMKTKELVEQSLKKATAEKAEVIAALEGVINEVQNREDEIESLSELLQRRDEELQHAKIIATKALQSAKDIQKRYKDKDEDRHSDLMGRMNEVSDNVDRLTAKNESLQRKISSLERELRDRNLECKRLKDQLRQIDGKPIRDTLTEDVSVLTTQSTYSMSYSNPANSGSVNGMRVETDTGRHDPPATIGSESFSPSTSPKSSTPDYINGTSGFGRHTNFPFVDRQYSEESVEDGNGGAASADDGAAWTPDFENESRYGESFANEHQSSQSRKSIERDALRKYVRQRYMKRG